MILLGVEDLYWKYYYSKEDIVEHRRQTEHPLFCSGIRINLSLCNK